MKSIFQILVVLISAAVYFVYIGPKAVTVKALSAEKSGYNNILEKSKELIDKRNTVLIDLNNIPQSDIDRLNKIVPETFNSVLFANEINSMILQNGMTVKDFQVDTPKTEARDVIVNQPKENSYKTTVVTVRLSGQYSQFLNFLRGVESSLRLVDVVGLSVKPIGGRTSSDSVLEFLLEMKTYSLR